LLTLALTRLSRDYNIDKDDVLKNLKRECVAAPPATTPVSIREPDADGSRKKEPKRRVVNSHASCHRAQIAL